MDVEMTKGVVAPKQRRWNGNGKQVGDFTRNEKVQGQSLMTVYR
jgi:hypothetical protein